MAAFSIMLLTTRLAKQLQDFYEAKGEPAIVVYAGTRTYRTLMCEFQEEFPIRLGVVGLKIGGIPILEHVVLPPDEIILADFNALDKDAKA